MMELAYGNEKKLFRIAVVVAAVLWVALVVGTLGIALIYLLLGYLVFLFVHSAFISQLKGNGVRITRSQYPDLHQRLTQCAETVGLTELPDIYLLRTDYFNALATKFLGRHYIVLFSDVVDALENQPGALNFYIGHEIGHIQRKHLHWSVFLFPALILPVLGTAYRRAEEYTCDRYGAACCETEDDIRVAMAAIAAGNSRCQTIDADAYSEQIAATGEFWMSFNELIGDYPWLTKRMASALAFRNNQEVKHPRRNLFAWMLSMIVPRFGAGGALSLLITVGLIGVLAAIAIPAYQEYIQKATGEAAYQAAMPVQSAVTEYAQDSQQWPESLIDLGFDSEVFEDPAGRFRISIYQEGMIGVQVGEDGSGEGRYIVLEPVVEEGRLTWVCYGQNVAENLLPASCR